MVKSWSLIASVLAVGWLIPAQAEAQVGIYNARTNYFYRTSGGGNPGFGGWQGGGVYHTGGGWVGPAGYSGGYMPSSFGAYYQPQVQQSYVIPGWGANSSSTGIGAAPRMRDSLMPAVGVPANSTLLLTNFNATTERSSILGASFSEGGTAAVVGPTPSVIETAPSVVVQPGCATPVR